MDLSTICSKADFDFIWPILQALSVFFALYFIYFEAPYLFYGPIFHPIYCKAIQN